MRWLAFLRAVLLGDPGPCACGHPWDAHEHYREGTECSLCKTCPGFRRG